MKKFFLLLSNFIKQITFRWAPVFLWAAFIFLLSAIPEPLDQTPPAFAQALRDMRLLGLEMVVVVSFIIHFSLYLVLGFLTARALLAEKDPALPLLLAAFALCALYALSDEFHQTFVPGRGFEVIDLVADALGILAGIRIKLVASGWWLVADRENTAER